MLYDFLLRSIPCLYTHNVCASGPIDYEFLCGGVETREEERTRATMYIAYTVHE